MSMQSYFVCKKCKKYGGFIDWLKTSTPNMDIVESYAFLMKHISSCREENIFVVYEEDIPENFEIEKNDDLKEYFPDLKILKQWQQYIEYHINIASNSKNDDTNNS
jgi:hypothetical protein